MSENEKKVIAVNKKASRAYILLERFEAGIALQGTEVKSLRAGEVSLKESFAFVKNEEVFIKNMHIKPYKHGNINNHDPLRLRKLLLHKGEIQRLTGKVQERGLTLVITKIYLNERGKVKVELALAKGKSTHDKRQDIKKREAGRDIARALKKNF